MINNNRDNNKISSRNKNKNNKKNSNSYRTIHKAFLKINQQKNKIRLYPLKIIPKNSRNNNQELSQDNSRMNIIIRRLMNLKL